MIMFVTRAIIKLNKPILKQPRIKIINNFKEIPIKLSIIAWVDLPIACKKALKGV